MKNKLIALALGSWLIFSSWIFIPEEIDEPFVVNYFEDEVKVYELQAGEESIQEKVRDESDGVFYEIARRDKKLETNGGRHNKEACGYLGQVLDHGIEGGVNEQETGEEIESWSGVSGGEAGELSSASAEPVPEVAAYSEPQSTEACETWVAETVANETESQGAANTVGAAPVEESGNTDIYGLLSRSLDAAGIGWWYPYAVAQMTQESQCNPWAENANGLDKGLFQYRITYWTQPESIFDVNAQIRVYVSQVQARLAAGLSIEETISRHYTSDYITEVNWQYVNDVLRWMH